MSRVLSLTLFCAIVVLAVDPPLLLLAFEDRAARAEVLARRADPSPELAAFLADVRAHTKRGHSIALLLPVRDRHEYERLWFRASYLLAGRSVLPMSRENVQRADYVAAWHVRFDGEVVVHGHGGTLVRRR